MNNKCLRLEYKISSRHLRSLLFYATPEGPGRTENIRRDGNWYEKKTCEVEGTRRYYALVLKNILVKPTK